MSEYWYLIPALLLGAMLGAALAYAHFAAALAAARSEREHLAANGEELAARLLVKEEELHDCQTNAADETEDRIRLEVQLEEERRRGTEQFEMLQRSRDQIHNEFSQLASQVLEERGDSQDKNSRERLDSLLLPLKEQLKAFRERVESVNENSTRDRATLLQRIDQLQELNQRIGDDALNLTRALKGESKTQGNWGEMILEKVLECAGLEKDREYHTQVAQTDRNGKRFFLDVLVELPENRQVIIDSKVSLTAYERYYNSEDPDEREQAIAEHVQSLRRHIQQLANKRYDQLPDIKSIDSTLLFIPIENAWTAALSHTPELFSEALDRRIIPVSPSSCLLALRIVEGMWRQQQQSKNVLLIADRAGALHDKFVGFVEALDEIARQLDKAQSSCDMARKRLSEGRGNLIQRSDELRQLGARTRKKLKEIDEEGTA